MAGEMVTNMAGENIPGKRKLYRSENPAIENAIKGPSENRRTFKTGRRCFQELF